MENIHFSGRMTVIDFLKRLYTLEEMPSYDSRYENALGDLLQHAHNNYDYEGNWVFDDSRFELIAGSDDKFLIFLCEMAHPLVRPDNQQAQRIVTIANDWLKEDGWEIFPANEIGGGKIYEYRQTNAVQRPQESEVEHIWTDGKLRFFISHRDAHKSEAKKLGEDLEEHGVSSFVAHDSIQAMSTWKHEIMKALQTMDACVCFITRDFYESEWTNQEVGYAIARGVPIYLYSVDRTDPRGFRLDTQAIKSGFPELVSCIKKDFQWNPNYKSHFIHNFIEARDGNWDYSKDQFYNLIGFDFNDKEIELIVDTFNRTDVASTNQLIPVLSDAIKPLHKEHPRLREFTHYREYLDKYILQKHSRNRYRIDRRGIIQLEGQK